MGENVATNDDVVRTGNIIKDVALEFIEASACREFRERDDLELDSISTAIDSCCCTEESFFSVFDMCLSRYSTCLDERDTTCQRAKQDGVLIPHHQC